MCLQQEKGNGHWLARFFSVALLNDLTLFLLFFFRNKTHQAGPSWRAVLRKKPPGVTLPSAHAVEREAALFLGLGENCPSSPPSSSSESSSSSPSRVPVPHVLALERSDQPLGTPFFVMEFVAGRVFADPALPGLLGGGEGEEKERRALYAAAAEALARIHSVDVRASPGLSKLLLSSKSNASGVNYCARQIQRWEGQYLAQAGSGKKRPLLPEMLELAAFLKSHVPKADASLEDSGGRPTLVHGDFRIDNLVFHCEAVGCLSFLVLSIEFFFFFIFHSFLFIPPFFPSPRKKPLPFKKTLKTDATTDSSPTVLAVLDWELATTGSALADAAYATLPWHLPPGVPALPSLPSELPRGLPTEREFREMYFSARERILTASQQQEQQQRRRGGGASGPLLPLLRLRRPGEREWGFYVALALFRAAAILAGVGARADEGNAASAGARAAGGQAVVRALARRALAVAGGAYGGASPPSSPRPPSSPPGLGPSPKAAAILAELRAFIRDRVVRHEAVADAHSRSADRWHPIPGLEELKREAKARGLWNLWLPRELAERVRATLLLASPGAEAAEAAEADAALLADPSLWGPGLSNLDYAHLAQEMGGTPWSAEVFNCSAPDTGNMEVLARCGDARQQRRWLVPLLRGEIRSCFAMTEPGVASSDATNMEATICFEGERGRIVLNGTKWWTSGALDARCRLCVFMGKDVASGSRPPSSPPPAKHRRHSMILVPMPSPGLTVRRALTVFGYDDAPHGHAEVTFENVTLTLPPPPATSSSSSSSASSSPASSPSYSPVVLGRGRGFEIAQARLGPGRLHHCMRLVGAGERALALAAARARRRRAFGGRLADLGGLQHDLARARVGLDGARLLVLHAAHVLDLSGGDARGARGALAAAKVAAPRAAAAALDVAVQVHGGAGVSQDTPLAALWAGARTLRLADGPDEVHLGTIAGLELRRSRDAEEEGAGGRGDRSRL